jgi:glycerophosphoryl diester phosphodiesterase
MSLVHWQRRERALVIAHRGASAEAPENTLAAFRLARAQGADGVELDVMRCASGEIVVFHDDDLARLGGGTASDQVRRMSWAQLRERDLGQGERMPLLDEVFDTVGPLRVNVELKSAPGWAERTRDDGLAAQVAALLQRRGSAEVLVSSFDPLLLRRFRAAAPEVPTGLLFAHDQSLPLRRAWARRLVSPSAMHPEAALVDALAMRGWRDAGLLVNVWTVDDADEIRCLDALAVDAIITNRPAATRTVLESQTT